MSRGRAFNSSAGRASTNSSRQVVRPRRPLLSPPASFSRSRGHHLLHLPLRGRCCARNGCSRCSRDQSSSVMALRCSSHSSRMYLSLPSQRQLRSCSGDKSANSSCSRELSNSNMGSRSSTQVKPAQRVPSHFAVAPAAAAPSSNKDSTAILYAPLSMQAPTHSNHHLPTILGMIVRSAAAYGHRAQQILMGHNCTARSLQTLSNWNRTPDQVLSTQRPCATLTAAGL